MGNYDLEPFFLCEEKTPRTLILYKKHSQPVKEVWTNLQEDKKPLDGVLSTDLDDFLIPTLVGRILEAFCEDGLASESEFSNSGYKLRKGNLRGHKVKKVEDKILFAIESVKYQLAKAKVSDTLDRLSGGDYTVKVPKSVADKIKGLAMEAIHMARDIDLKDTDEEICTLRIASFIQVEPGEKGGDSNV